MVTGAASWSCCCTSIMLLHKIQLVHYGALASCHWCAESKAGPFPIMPGTLLGISIGICTSKFLEVMRDINKAFQSVSFSQRLGELVHGVETAGCCFADDPDLGCLWCRAARKEWKGAKNRNCAFVQSKGRYNSVGPADQNVAYASWCYLFFDRQAKYG